MSAFGMARMTTTAPSSSIASEPVAAPPAPTPPPAAAARFVSGSLLRHVSVMSGTAAVGLMAVFAVDLINLFYLSRLGDKAITAAIGFTGVIGFFHTSVCIGLTIGISAITARAVGAGKRALARRQAASSLVWMLLCTSVVAVATLLALRPLLHGLGAPASVVPHAERYLSITLLSFPLLGLGFASSALLRAVGDARRAMHVTLGSAGVTLVLDPLLIFGAGLGLTGAAITSVLARSMLAAVAWRYVRRQDLVGQFDRAHWLQDGRHLAAVAAPALLTNLATPVAAAFITHSIAPFGASAVAGQATIDRVAPVAFGLVFALSGAVGPILGQNLGARRYDRVQEGLVAALKFMVIAVTVAWGLLAASQPMLVRAFALDAGSTAMMTAFCTWLAPSFYFVGALFVANAAFNNLGKPLWSTAFNWGRATLGTIPLVWWGSRWGPVGVLAGQALGGVIFGTAAMAAAFALTRHLARRDDRASAS